MAFFEYDTILGRVTIVETRGQITRVSPAFDASILHDERSETRLIREAYQQLRAYFDGKLFEFTLPLAPKGTDFQQSVWRALREIPYGETASYKDIAIRVGNPNAVRAVGMANNRNPIAIVIPCHRVIGSNGQLVGYRSGLENKRLLLELEARYATQGLR
jgi:methylated-DNA-[protein]-cysteine S-methyltransferase